MPQLSRADSAGTRSYVSPKRQEQANATRRAILEAAQRLFVANGVCVLGRAFQDDGLHIGDADVGFGWAHA